jgi:tetratricopeptide (TPR) repeat protein
MDTWIAWILENKTWLFSGVGIFILAGFGRWIFVKRRLPPADTLANYNIADTDNIIINQAPVYARARKGGTAIVVGGNIVHGITLNEYEIKLKEKEKQFRNQILKLSKSEKNKRAILKRKLGYINVKLTNLNRAFEDHTEKISQVIIAVENLKKEYPKDQLLQARNDLLLGKTDTVEKLFKDVLINSKKNASEASYYLGILAENQNELESAYEFYCEAAKFDSNNPRYLEAWGKFAYIIGKYSEAENAFTKALDIRQNAILRKSSTDVATSFNNLAVVNDAQGKYEDALNNYGKALDLLKKKLGSEHLAVGQTLCNLAGLYRYKGQLYKAEELYTNAAKIFVNRLGESHPDVATIYNNLGTLLLAYSKYSDAENLFKKSLSIRIEHFGLKHPYVGQLFNNLAELYRAQKLYKKAEIYYVKDLKIAKEIYGLAHPEVAITLNNLGEMYRFQGDYDKAERFYLRALKIREKMLDPQSPGIAQTLNNLGRLYEAKKDLQNSKLCINRALKIRENTLGPDHVDFAQSLSDLAKLEFISGNLTEAEDKFRRSIKIYEKNGIISDPDFEGTLRNLSQLLLKLERTEEATFVEARINENLREELSKIVADQLISVQNLSLTTYERSEVEKQINERILNPDKNHGPIIISRKVSGGSTASSPISDGKLKKNVERISDALESIQNLRGVVFNWRKDRYPKMVSDNLPQVGFIAQEVEKILPTLVFTDHEGYKHVHYANLVAVLVEAIKEQQKQIENIKRKI